MDDLTYITAWPDHRITQGKVKCVEWPESTEWIKSLIISKYPGQQRNNQ